MKKIKIILSICFLIYFGGGCGEGNNNQKEPELSASVTAVRKSDGTIEIRETNDKEIKYLEQSIKRHGEVDRKYPGPLKHKDIVKLKLFKVKSVSKKGIISLVDGPDLALEGIKCNLENQNYITKMISGENDRVAFIPSSKSNNTPMSAYIWHADISIMKDPELKDFITQPFYTSLNEGAITSGWCAVKETENNKYYQRYLALEKLSKSSV